MSSSSLLLFLLPSLLLLPPLLPLLLLPSLLLLLLLALQSLVDLSLSQKLSSSIRLPIFEASQQNSFMGWAVSPTSNPQTGGPGYPFLFGSSPLTCLAWEALPVVTLLPAQLSGSFDHASLTIISK